jgi:crossover junction endodeoxyribonuclease RuvC
MKIIGIDPGYAIVGYSILEYSGNKFNVIDYGTVITEAGVDFSKRLLKIYKGLEHLIAIHEPDAMAVEDLFFNRNTKTAIKVSQGRGVAMLCGSLNGVDVFEYTPLQVKQAVCGYGRAQKRQVQEMVKILLKLESIPRPDDAADALAVAVCHAHSYNLNMIGEKR